MFDRRRQWQPVNCHHLVFFELHVASLGLRLFFNELLIFHSSVFHFRQLSLQLGNLPASASASTFTHTDLIFIIILLVQQSSKKMWEDLLVFFLLHFCQSSFKFVFVFVQFFCCFTLYCVPVLPSGVIKIEKSISVQVISMTAWLSITTVSCHNNT